MMQTAARPKPWTARDLAILALMLGVCGWIFREPLADILHIGSRDTEQSHIFLAPFIAAWLVWLRRARLRFIRVQPSLIGTAVVLAGCLLSWWGFESDTQIAWHGGALVAFVGVVLTMTGVQPVWHFAAAFASLAFLLPVPGMIRQQISIPLQSMATEITYTCLELFGYSVSKLGNVLVINGEHVAVAEACNGMRLVFSLTLVVYAFAFSTPLRPATRVLLIALSPLVALLANVIRLVPTSLMYGMFTPAQAEMFHDLSGWAMLPIALFGLIGLLRMFRWLELPVSSYRLVHS